MLKILRLRHYLFQRIREFFEKRGYVEVETPYIVKTVPPDPHIDPVSVYVDGQGPLFLHTSPEIEMKKLLSRNLNRIFQICRVFRAEKEDRLHRVEFTMLEWYREGNYIDTLKETEELLSFLTSSMERDFGIGRSLSPPFPVYDLEELFVRFTGINPFRLDGVELYETLKKRGFLGISKDDLWIDIFFKVFLETIEPAIDKSTPYFIVGWPSSLSSMAKEKNGKAERFELYIKGIEIANGYSELLCPSEQRRRFERDNLERKRMGKKEMEIEEDFIACLSQIREDYSGVALGVERLIMVITGEKDIGSVTPFSL